MLTLRIFNVCFIFIFNPLDSSFDKVWKYINVLFNIKEIHSTMEWS